MKQTALFLVFITSLWLTACGSTPPATVTNQAKIKIPSIPQLYLKGSFTQWEIQQNYRLEALSKTLFAAAANLQKGETVEFMFSAKDASKAGANCGYSQSDEQIITLGKKNQASCTNVVLQNFTFTPTDTAVFEFFIDFTKPSQPLVFVQKVY